MTMIKISNLLGLYLCITMFIHNITCTISLYYYYCINFLSFSANSEMNIQAMHTNKHSLTSYTDNLLYHYTSCTIGDCC